MLKRRRLPVPEVTAAQREILEQWMRQVNAGETEPLIKIRRRPTFRNDSHLVTGSLEL